MEENSILKTENFSALTIDWVNIVERTISNWQIEEITLLTRIGGIIGVGKELLWVMMITGSSITLAINYCRYKDKQ